MRRMTEHEVIERAKALFKELQDSYITALEEQLAFGKGRMTDEEKKKACEAHINSYFGRPYTLEDFIKEALKESRRRSKMSDSKFAQNVYESRKGMDKIVDTGAANVS